MYLKKGSNPHFRRPFFKCWTLIIYYYNNVNITKHSITIYVCIIVGMSPYVCDCTNVVYMFCVYCIYYYVNKFYIQIMKSLR